MDEYARLYNTSFTELREEDCTIRPMAEEDIEENVALIVTDPYNPTCKIKIPRNSSVMLL